MVGGPAPSALSKVRITAPASGSSVWTTSSFTDFSSRSILVTVTLPESFTFFATRNAAGVRDSGTWVASSSSLST